MKKKSSSSPARSVPVDAHHAGTAFQELQAIIAQAGTVLDDQSAEFVVALRDAGDLTDDDWSAIRAEFQATLKFLGEPPRSASHDEEGRLIIDLDGDPRNADWLRSSSAMRKAGYRLPLWASLWLWRLGHDRGREFWSRVSDTAKDFGYPPFP